MNGQNKSLLLSFAALIAHALAAFADTEAEKAASTTGTTNGTPTANPPAAKPHMSIEDIHSAFAASGDPLTAEESQFLHATVAAATEAVPSISAPPPKNVPAAAAATDNEQTAAG